MVGLIRPLTVPSFPVGCSREPCEYHLLDWNFLNFDYSHFVVDHYFYVHHLVLFSVAWMSRSMLAALAGVFVLTLLPLYVYKN